MRIVVTGGCGFIGSAAIRHAVNDMGATVLNIDKLTYAAMPEALEDVVASERYSFLQADICDGPAMAKAFADFAPDAVLHLAAESHVDRSIDGPMAFIHTNVIGTAALLEAARHYWSGLAPSRGAAFVSTMSRPMRCSGRWTLTSPASPKQRLTGRVRPIRRPRRDRTIWCGPGERPTACRS